MSDAERERGRGDEHQVTPLQLFFDLTFVFAITQVTSLLADDPTWGGVVDVLPRPRARRRGEGSRPAAGAPSTATD